MTICASWQGGVLKPHWHAFKVTIQMFWINSTSIQTRVFQFCISVQLTLVIIQMVVFQLWLSHMCYTLVNQTLSIIPTCVSLEIESLVFDFSIKLICWLIKMFMTLICLPWTSNFNKDSPSTRRKTQEKCKGWRETLWTKQIIEFFIDQQRPVTKVPRNYVIDLCQVGYTRLWYPNVTSCLSATLLQSRIVLNALCWMY